MKMIVMSEQWPGACANCLLHSDVMGGPSRDAVLYYLTMRWKVVISHLLYSIMGGSQYSVLRARLLILLFTEYMDEIGRFLG